MTWTMISLLIPILISITSNQVACQDGLGFNISQARQAIAYVERIKNSPCTGGTEEVLPVQFDHAIWSTYAEIAVWMANFLTKIFIQKGNNFDNLSHDFIFDIIRNTVDGDTLIFGSAICFDENVFPKYNISCPYAYKKGSIIYSHDLALNYNYLDSEYMSVLRQKDWSTADISEHQVEYRYNSTAHTELHPLYQPLAQLGDGHWTLPYFDCGGGDVWMVTYSAPIFGLIGGQAVFKGIATIDIELTNIDINQCDIEDTDSETRGEVAQSSGVDVFRGTHYCQTTTKCVPVVGRGFKGRAYKCVCKDGYYFPNTSLPNSEKYYSGEVLETMATSNGTETYTCLECAEGCDTCVDDSPCLYSYILPLRVTLLVLSIIAVIMIGLMSVLVAINRDKKVIKSASPAFLQIICAGAILMVVPMFVHFNEPNRVLCIAGPLPRHLGFCLAYGGLLIKIWRIKAIFKMKSAKNLSDNVLPLRLLPFIILMLVYLSVWSALGGMTDVWRETTSSGLKFRDCASNAWHYTIAGVETAFLLFGAYLCFVARKVPSVFNESKYITSTIYINIFLGSFIIIAREFIAVGLGPDIIYVFDFLYVQVSVTSIMCLIFIPKMWVVCKKIPEDKNLDMDKMPNQDRLNGRDDTIEKRIQVNGEGGPSE